MAKGDEQMLRIRAQKVENRPENGHYRPNMFEECEWFTSTEEIGKDFPTGSQGVVLVVFDSDPPAYEVESFDTGHNTIGLETVKESQIDTREPDAS